MDRNGFAKVLMMVVCVVVAGIFSAASATVASFDDLSLASESYWGGSAESDGFQSGGAYFYNNFVDWGGGVTSWDGWAYSNMTDTTTPGYSNQCSAYTGGGVNGSSNYGVSYVGMNPTRADFINTTTGYPVQDAYITNTTYAALSMLNGDAYAKKFGGDTGDDPDWFKLIITGIGSTAAPVEFYLADYRFADNSQDYIVDDWAWVDLSSLGEVTGLEFSVASSDVGALGINTPTYFAMDNLTYIPEPMSILLLGTGGLVIRGRKNVG